jgi:hypothetical protein
MVKRFTTVSEVLTFNMVAINNAKPTIKILSREPNIDPTSTISDCSFGEYVQIEKYNQQKII